ncbi:hypothetical protein OSB04_002641 [Centaurea solstitialis]|uniref:Uncharacterized protein n=1 Tax=Centaurea solstitialis TaxID=347529 RepID=A0AA38WTB7_9ASTR|nr:hypothetical protein OSB04_002641 [Centaurea solstitialis]
MTLGANYLKLIAFVLGVLGHHDGSSQPLGPTDTKWGELDSIVKLWIYVTISVSLEMYMFLIENQALFYKTASVRYRIVAYGSNTGRKRTNHGVAFPICKLCEVQVRELVSSYKRKIYLTNLKLRHLATRKRNNEHI